MPVRAGQRCSAWRVRRCRRLSLVDSGGGLGTVSDGALSARRVAAVLRIMIWQNVPVPPSSPYQFELTDDERAALVAMTRPSSQARTVLRARIGLAAAGGAGNAAIARQQRVHVDTVRKWRSRFWRRRLAGLSDAARCGRPPRFSAVQAVQVKALACELPAIRGVPLSR